MPFPPKIVPFYPCRKSYHCFFLFRGEEYYFCLNYSILGHTEIGIAGLYVMISSSHPPQEKWPHEGRGTLSRPQTRVRDLIANTLKDLRKFMRASVGERLRWWTPPYMIERREEDA